MIFLDSLRGPVLERKVALDDQMAQFQKCIVADQYIIETEPLNNALLVVDFLDCKQNVLKDN